MSRQLYDHWNDTWSYRYAAEGIEEAADVAEEAEVAGEPTDEPEAMPIEKAGSGGMALKEDSTAIRNEAANEDMSQDVEALKSGE